MSDVTVKGILCGTYQRVTYEVFGWQDFPAGGGQWFRIKETDNEYEAERTYNDPAMRKAYKNRMAWAERIVIETRILKDANVPVYQLVMQMRGEDGEPGETIKTEYEDLAKAVIFKREALAMPDCLSAALVDLSTGRSVDI